MVGATPVILTKGVAGYAVVRRAEQTFRNKELSRLYLQALKRPGLHPALVIEESLRLLRRKPPTPEAGALLVSTIASHHGLDAALEAQRRLTESLPAVGCQALGQWPLESIERLIPYRTQFLRVCGDLPTKDLHTDHVLSRIPRPVLE